MTDTIETTTAEQRIATFLTALRHRDGERQRAEGEPEFLAGVPGPDGTYHELRQEDVEALLAKTATASEQLATITQQLNLIFQAHAVCAACAAEARQGTRPNANFVNVIVDGTGYCHDHVGLVRGKLLPFTTSGPIVTGS